VGCRRAEAPATTTATATTTTGSDPLIDPDALMEHVKEVDGSSNWARYVAELTNLDRPKVEDASGQREMLFQQLVFSPISGLWYCFNTSNYVAGDGLVSSGFLFSKFTPPKKRQSDPTPRSLPNYPFTCKPDAAVLATAKNVCPCHDGDEEGRIGRRVRFRRLLQLRPVDGRDGRRAGPARRRRNGPRAPFVVAVGEGARL
jgi:hypothetical protein